MRARTLKTILSNDIDDLRSLVYFEYERGSYLRWFGRDGHEVNTILVTDY